MGKHIIVGAGQVGSTLATTLAGDGHDVTLISRTGNAPHGVKPVATDAADTDRLITLTTGADSLINCVNPAYHRWLTDWPPIADSLLRTATATDAAYIMLGNLYIYQPPTAPLRETDPLAPTSRKAEVRVRMWRGAMAAHEAGRARVTEIRASDYFGPGCRDQSHLGERFVPRLLAGKRVQVFGNTDLPHSWTYVPDVARALAIAATDERSLGRPWHVPTNQPATYRQLADRISHLAGIDNPGLTRMPEWLTTTVGMFSPMVRELKHVKYQFDKPFTIDSTDFETTFGQQPTPIDTALQQTIDWWRAQAPAATQR